MVKVELAWFDVLRTRSRQCFSALLISVVVLTMLHSAFGITRSHSIFAQKALHEHATEHVHDHDSQPGSEEVSAAQSPTKAHPHHNASDHLHEIFAITRASTLWLFVLHSPRDVVLNISTPRSPAPWRVERPPQI